MAKLSADGKSVTVQKGDTLTQIAVDYAGGYSKYKQLAAINNISNPDRIYVGQVIKLAKGSSTGSSAKKTNSDTLKATVDHFGLQSNADNTLFASWTWTKENTESYKVLWKYDTGDGVWFIGNSSTITVDEYDPHLATQSTFSIPSNAKYVQFRVKPVSKTYKKNGTDTHYWTAEWSTEKTWADSTPLATPTGLKVEVDKYKLTASLANINIAGADTTEFRIWSIESEAPKEICATGTSKIVNGSAAYSCTLPAGGEYQVQCRAAQGKSLYSEWTEFSESYFTPPVAPAGIQYVIPKTETSVQLKWAKVAGAKRYDIEYTDDQTYFDRSSQTTVVSTPEDGGIIYIITGLETGKEYFFRVRAVNSEGMESGWSNIKSIAIGTDPAAPTTWSSTTTAIVGEQIVLYWIHNAEDGSRLTYSHLELEFDQVGIDQNTSFEAPTIGADGDSAKTDSFEESLSGSWVKINLHIKNPEAESPDEEDENKTNSYVINTSDFSVGGVPIDWSEGSKIKWRVRTAGITKKYGDWSIERTVNVYAPPTLTLSVLDSDDIATANQIDTLTKFPFYIKGVPGPETQVPTGYHLSIISNDTYETVDNKGNLKTVNAGDTVYSKYFDISESLFVKIGPGDIDLENNAIYTIKCTVSMDSGLTAERYTNLTVAWTDVEYAPNAEISIDTDTLTAYIRPYCEDSSLVTYRVERSGRSYVVTDEEVSDVWGEVVPKTKTSTGELVYSGVTADDEELYFCYKEVKTPITDVLMSVYRREFDGSFVEIASELDGTQNITVSDPHPALDYARYRIVAVTKDTGAVSYVDLPGYPVGGKAAVIQWDETWSNFDVTEDEVLSQPPWTGSLLKLPYNIDVSDNTNPDVALIEYIGREHPVGYYGTQVGQSSNWSMTIEKEDKETLYALRRLQRWMGNVYVREPSGSGYWASVTVSFSQKHCEVTIPVTLSITRVEGGM